jgi:uncharacterized protein YneF (UPF0154 family)
MCFPTIFFKMASLPADFLFCFSVIDYLVIFAVLFLTMDLARQQLKKNAPAAIVQQTIRTLMTSPGPVARLAIHDLTKPTSSQKKWIKRFDNHHWKGAIIAPDAKKDSEQAALDRLKNAELVIYEIHGKYDKLV